MEKIGNRIAKLREAVGMSQSDLAREVGLTPQAVQKWESGGAPRGKRLTVVAEILRTSVEYLLTGENEPEQSNLPSVVKTDVPQYLLVPMLNAEPRMGAGGVLPEYDMVIDGLRLSKDWVHQNLPAITSPQNLTVLSAFGDSMSPTLNDGDILLVDCGVHELKLDAVYVLALNDELFVKRVQRNITNGAVTIKSDNTLYDPVTVANHEKDSLRVLGRVVWAWNARRL